MHKELVTLINTNIPEAKAESPVREVGDQVLFIESTQVSAVCELLKTHQDTEFNVLHVITGCDYEDRIEVSYILSSYTKNTELILKTKVPRDNPKIQTVSNIWSAANWQERECYDMLGVEFLGHPDPRRLLCPDDWEGFPLRKDYVVQEKYRHMTVNPVHKMNIADREFEKILKEKEAKLDA